MWNVACHFYLPLNYDPDELFVLAISFCYRLSAFDRSKSYYLCPQPIIRLCCSNPSMRPLTPPATNSLGRGSKGVYVCVCAIKCGSVDVAGVYCCSQCCCCKKLIAVNHCPKRQKVTSGPIQTIVVQIELEV